MAKITKPKYWAGDPDDCDFARGETDHDMSTFVDGVTKHGPWANMCLKCFELHGVGEFGQGIGQKYVRQENGLWLKVAG